ncbi:MAG TPA: multicopper oxidase domain-containing protein [Rhodopila sp.]|nr:multicopper oxidase domain-containing protein [Rhodopila sp.]
MAGLSRRAVVTAASAIALKPARLLAASSVQLTVERRALDVNGKPASVLAVRQPDGTPGVMLAPGQRFQLQLHNTLDTPTIVHWHGQTPPPDQDGVADTGLVKPIGPGASQAYDFVARSGTHWMHSHQGLQEAQLLAAPLIVRDAQDVASGLPETVVLLHDFSFQDPQAILASLTGSGGMAAAPRPAMAMPGKGSVAGMSTEGMSMPGMSMAAAGATKGAAAAPAPDLNDVDFDAYLANDRTLDDPQIIRVERGGRVRLRLINGAAATAFWIDLGTLKGSVVAVDGDPVHPVPVRRFPMAQAQRVDVLVQIPQAGGAFPILAQREGDRQRTGVILATQRTSIHRISGIAERAAGAADLSLEYKLRAIDPLHPKQADITHRVTLDGSMMPYAWHINGRDWANRAPLAVNSGKRVVLELVNTTPMAHPMHLHGHHFQVVTLNGVGLSGAMRDTVMVPGSGTVRIAFDTDNPGRWLFHCHNLFHMATGMITEVVYTDFK